MVVGDVVSAIYASGTVSYQPAAGVEILVTSLMTQTGAWVLYDGVNESTLMGGPPELNTKVFINNTNYLRFLGAVKGSFTGVQTK